MDIRARKLAEVILKYSFDLKPGDKLLISGGEETIPFIKEVYREAVKMGVYPQVDLGIEELTEILLKYGNDEQIAYVPESAKKAFESVDAILTVWGEKIQEC